MPNSQQPPVIRKKVKPYPFGCYMEGNDQKLRIQIVHLTPVAFMAKLAQEILQVGNYYKCEFDLPVLRHSVVVRVRVIKTHDRAPGTKDAPVERFAEFHFEDLTDPDRKVINHFLKAIGQK